MKMKMKILLTASRRIRDLQGYSMDKQGAELMSKHGINVPKGVAVSSVEEVRKAISDVFPKENELVVKSQILAGGRGLGTFKSGHKGGVHIVKTNEAQDIAGKMLGQVLVTKQTGALGETVSKSLGTKSFIGSSSSVAGAKSCELSPKLVNFFGNMTGRNATMLNALGNRFYSTATGNEKKPPVKVRCIIKGSSMVTGGGEGRVRVRCILKGCSIISGGKSISGTAQPSSRSVGSWLVGVMKKENFKSTVKMMDQILAPYQNLLDGFMKIWPAITLTYRFLVYFIALIFGEITIHSVYKKVKEVLAIVQEMQVKLNALAAELKMKNAPLQPSAQFHWPWTPLQQLQEAPTRREPAPFREPKKYF